MTVGLLARLRTSCEIFCAPLRASRAIGFGESKRAASPALPAADEGSLCAPSFDRSVPFVAGWEGATPARETGAWLHGTSGLGHGRISRHSILLGLIHRPLFCYPFLTRRVPA